MPFRPGQTRSGLLEHGFADIARFDIGLTGPGCHYTDLLRLAPLSKHPQQTCLMLTRKRYRQIDPCGSSLTLIEVDHQVLQ
jgi:hypothetical protein